MTIIIALETRGVIYGYLERFEDQTSVLCHLWAVQVNKSDKVYCQTTSVIVIILTSIGNTVNIMSEVGTISTVYTSFAVTSDT